MWLKHIFQHNFSIYLSSIRYWNGVLNSSLKLNQAGLLCLLVIKQDNNWLLKEEEEVEGGRMWGRSSKTQITANKSNAHTCKQTAVQDSFVCFRGVESAKASCRCRCEPDGCGAWSLLSVFGDDSEAMREDGGGLCVNDWQRRTSEHWAHSYRLFSLRFEKASLFPSVPDDTGSQNSEPAGLKVAPIRCL